jgi:hypothetical protein
LFNYEFIIFCKKTLRNCIVHVFDMKAIFENLLAASYVEAVTACLIFRMNEMESGYHLISVLWWKSVCVCVCARMRAHVCEGGSLKDSAIQWEGTMD